jgi:hypothetical protein
MPNTVPKIPQKGPVIPMQPKRISSIGVFLDFILNYPF